MNPNHDFNIVLEFTPATPILLILALLVLANFFKKRFPEYMEKNDFTMSRFNKTVIESLPAYNNVVQASEADKLIKSNRYFQRNFDFQVSTKAMNDSLINQRVSLSPMASIPWYNVLFNY